MQSSILQNQNQIRKYLSKTAKVMSKRNQNGNKAARYIKKFP